MIEYKNGIHIKDLLFWLDAKKKTDFSFISHAHIDHVARHKEILATEETKALYEHRLGKVKAITLGYHIPKKVKGIKVELFPSGHILGSAQILLDLAGTRIVYTGDFKLRKSLTAKRGEIKKCDILIMESTFGLPRYVFPPAEEIYYRIIDFVEKALNQRKVPVILAYSLGKAQESIKLLGDKGFRLSLHGTVYNLVKIYEEFGVKFKNYEKYHPENLKGKVLITPPWTRNHKMVQELPHKRIAFLTGWGMDNGAKYSFRADEVFPLSDHADFKELLEYAKESNPEKIYVVHGFKEFVEHLKKLGFDAEELNEGTRFDKNFNKEILVNYDLFR
ncbi:MAG: MBL fold metallo-hydrolase [candidate division Zixibacteria bacterium]|nr:MBL fold metallo-hydrolase [candidate division Zixibacteria bacterium]